MSMQMKARDERAYEFGQHDGWLEEAVNDSVFERPCHVTVESPTDVGNNADF